jgi:hypothetical protein
MAQLHFYIPDAVAEKIKIRAEQAHLSVSKYLAELAKREVANEWPENYFDIFGGWHKDTQGIELKRPEQLPLEQREALD